MPQERREAVTDQPLHLHLRLTGSKFIISMVPFTDILSQDHLFRCSSSKYGRKWNDYWSDIMHNFPSQNHTMWGPKKTTNAISLLTPFQLWLCFLTRKMARLIEGNCSSTTQFLLPQVLPVLVCMLPALSKLQCRAWCWHASTALSTWRKENHIVRKVSCRGTHCHQQKSHSHFILSGMYKWSTKKHWIWVSW